MPQVLFSFLAGAGGWQRWFFTILSVVIAGAIALDAPVATVLGVPWPSLTLFALAGGLGFGLLIAGLRR